MTLSLEDRFWAKVDRNGPLIPDRPELGPCWLWTGAQRGDGYGVIYVDVGVNDYAHRVSWRLFRGPIPFGLVIDHFACYRHNCVNPDHLEPTTQQKNAMNRSPEDRARRSR